MTTLKEVAALAGVSLMTASNVVNDKPTVAESTRARVLDAIERLDYRPNLSARSLARGRSGIVNLAVPDISIPYFAELAASFMRTAASMGQRMLIEQTDGSSARELALRSGAAPLLGDALVLYPTLATSDLRVVPALPTVLLGGVPGLDGPARVTIDNEMAAREVIERLVHGGSKRIGVIGPMGESDDSASGRRLAGSMAAMASVGLPLDVGLFVDARTYHRQDGYRAANVLFALDPAPDAVFCFSDQLAIGVMRALRERGLRVPNDVAIVGFDDIEDAAYLDPPLSTVRVDRESVAARALSLV